MDGSSDSHPKSHYGHPGSMDWRPRMMAEPHGARFPCQDPCHLKSGQKQGSSLPTRIGVGSSLDRAPPPLLHSFRLRMAGRVGKRSSLEELSPESPELRTV